MVDSPCSFGHTGSFIAPEIASPPLYRPIWTFFPSYNRRGSVLNDRIDIKEEKDRGHILRLQFAIVCLKELNKEMRGKRDKKGLRKI